MAKRNPRTHKNRLCNICNTLYVPTSSSQKYCMDCRDGEYKRKNNKRTRQWYQEHRDEARKYRLDYYQRNKIKFQKLEKEYCRKRKIKVFEAYGGSQCSICNTNDFEVLTVDHIKGGGTKHRRSFKSYDGQAIYRWIIKNKFPVGFRVLCRNCNWKEHLKSYEN